VPVYINGVDASWGIVEGEFGLDRPNEVAPTVVYRPYLVGLPYGVPPYFPADGRRPGYGRLEIVPPAHHHPPAPGPIYRRFWSSESDPGPATEFPSGPPPSAIVAPMFNRHRGMQGRTNEDQRARSNRSASSKGR
jgi:hypothetical protein